eukprot:366254-Chlamydomonas_euryale.AAC.4
MRRSLSLVGPLTSNARQPFQPRRRSPTGRAQLFILDGSPDGRGPCRRSEARVALSVARPSPEARPGARPPRDGRRKRDPSAIPPRTVGSPPTAW